MITCGPRLVSMRVTQGPGLASMRVTWGPRRVGSIRASYRARFYPVTQGRRPCLAHTWHRLAHRAPLAARTRIVRCGRAAADAAAAPLRLLLPLRLHSGRPHKPRSSGSLGRRGRPFRGGWRGGGWRCDAPFQAGRPLANTDDLHRQDTRTTGIAVKRQQAPMTLSLSALSSCSCGPNPEARDRDSAVHIIGPQRLPLVCFEPAPVDVRAVRAVIINTTPRTIIAALAEDHVHSRRFATLHATAGLEPALLLADWSHL